MTTTNEALVEDISGDGCLYKVCVRSKTVEQSDNLTLSCFFLFRGPRSERSATVVVGGVGNCRQGQ